MAMFTDKMIKMIMPQIMDIFEETVSRIAFKGTS